jgi:hypothetical protein
VGFCPRKSAINQTFALQKILEKIKEFRISIIILLTDLKSAYDNNEREQMYEAMNELNIPEKLIRLVRMIYLIGRARSKFSRSSQHLS